MGIHFENSLEPANVLTERRGFIEAVLLKKCSDERSRQKAMDIVADVIADCFGASERPRGERRLLNLYTGRAPLEQWVITVAHSRLKNWWRSGQWRYESPESSLPDGSEWQPPMAESAAEDPDTVALLAEALLSAFDTLEPRQVVLMRLCFLHGIKKETLASVWNCHPSTVGRDITDGLEKLRVRSMAFLKSLDPLIEIEWADCLAVCRNYPGVLDGTNSERDLQVSQQRVSNSGSPRESVGES